MCMVDRTRSETRDKRVDPPGERGRRRVRGEAGGDRGVELASAAQGAIQHVALAGGGVAG